jgi:hypothetical protein
VFDLSRVDWRAWLAENLHGGRPAGWHRPHHDITVATVFRALTLEPALLPDILTADELPTETKQMAAQGRTFALG